MRLNPILVSLIQLSLLLRVSAASTQVDPLLKSTPEKGDVHQLSSFCNKFNSACTQVCVHKKKGEQKIEVSCGSAKHATRCVPIGEDQSLAAVSLQCATGASGQLMRDPPLSSSYQFSCHCNGKERTGDTLKKLSGSAGDTVTDTKTKKVVDTRTSVKTVSSTSQPDAVFVTSTHSDISTTQLPDESTTTTQVLSFTDTATTSITQTDVSRTTQTPLATSCITTTLTSLSTVTSTSTTFGYGIPEAGRVASPVLKVGASKSSKSEKNSKSAFCLAYSRSCARECARVKSTVGKQLCRKTRDGVKLDYYDLNCVCANKKTESLHALNHIDRSDPDKTLKATVLSTSTSYIHTTTSRITTAAVVTNTIVSTVSSTVTLPVTSTSTSVTQTSSTTTDSTATLTSSTSTTSTETAPTSTITSVGFTATTVSTNVIPTSTYVIVAPTGRLRFDKAINPPTVDGYLSTDTGAAGFYGDTGSAVTSVALMRRTMGLDSSTYDPLYWLMDVANNKLIKGFNYNPNDIIAAMNGNGKCSYTIFQNFPNAISNDATAIAAGENFPYLVRLNGGIRTNTINPLFGREVPLKSSIISPSTKIEYSPQTVIFHNRNAALDAGGNSIAGYLGDINACAGVSSTHKPFAVNMVFEFVQDD